MRHRGAGQAARAGPGRGVFLRQRSADREQCVLYDGDAIENRRDRAESRVIAVIGKSKPHRGSTRMSADRGYCVLYEGDDVDGEIIEPIVMAEGR